MKKVLILLAVAFVACTSQVKKGQQEDENTKGPEHSSTAVPLNNGSKWKADQATKKNVAGLIEVVSDSNYTDAARRQQLYVALQTKIDTLVKQCRMQGPDHDALHAWLEKVLRDMKELKGENDDYMKVYAGLKKDVEDFNTLFE